MKRSVPLSLALALPLASGCGARSDFAGVPPIAADAGGADSSDAASSDAITSPAACGTTQMFPWSQGGAEASSECDYDTGGYVTWVSSRENICTARQQPGDNVCYHVGLFGDPTHVWRATCDATGLCVCEFDGNRCECHSDPAANCFSGYSGRNCCWTN